MAVRNAQTSALRGRARRDSSLSTARMKSLPFPEACPLRAEMAIAADIAWAAGSIVMRHFGRLAAVDYKAGREPLTQADRECHAYIAARLREAFPNDAVLSEEGRDDGERFTRERVWIVDPLDGTQEFVAGLQQFVVMIGLCMGQEPRLGVILHPGAQALYMGIPGWGAFRATPERNRQLRVSEQAAVARMHAVVSRSHLTPLMEEIATALGFAGCLRRGSAGLKAALVAMRAADCYFFASWGMKEWDLCAPAAVLRAAGARLTDCWGDGIPFNQPELRLPRGFIASNGRQHDRLVEAIRTRCEAYGYAQKTGFRP